MGEKQGQINRDREIENTQRLEGERERWRKGCTRRERERRVRGRDRDRDRETNRQKVMGRKRWRGHIIHPTLK